MDLDGVTIACPRCAKPMEPFIKRGEGVEVTADMCFECGGLWLDGAEVRALHPTLAAAASGAPGSVATAKAPLLACPRCGDLPTPFFFFELELDVCSACKGVWVDGDELTDLARSADRIDGRSVPEAASYRDNAADALRSGRVTCTGCGVDLDLDAVEPTSKGPLCRPCAEKFREDLFERALPHYEVPKNAILPSFDDIGRGLRAAATLLGMVLVEHRRAACGCHVPSRCAHGSDRS